MKKVSTVVSAGAGMLLAGCSALDLDFIDRLDGPNLGTTYFPPGSDMYSQVENNGVPRSRGSVNNGSLRVKGQEGVIRTLIDDLTGVKTPGGSLQTLNMSPVTVNSISGAVNDILGPYPNPRPTTIPEVPTFEPVSVPVAAVAYLPQTLNHVSTPEELKQEWILRAEDRLMQKSDPTGRLPEFLNGDFPTYSTLVFPSDVEVQSLLERHGELLMDFITSVPEGRNAYFLDTLHRKLYVVENQTGVPSVSMRFTPSLSREVFSNEPGSGGTPIGQFDFESLRTGEVLRDVSFTNPTSGQYMMSNKWEPRQAGDDSEFGPNPAAIVTSAIVFDWQRGLAIHATNREYGAPQPGGIPPQRHMGTKSSGGCVRMTHLDMMIMEMLYNNGDDFLIL